jgi:hypothetical protein
MRKFTLWASLLLLLPLTGCAEKDPAVQVTADSSKETLPENTIRDTWDAAYLEGARTGYFHTTVVEEKRPGKKVFITTQEMSLSIKRYKAVIKQRLQQTVEEDAEGKILAYTMTTYSDKGDPQVVKGRVEGDKLLVKAGNKPNVDSFPWNAKAIGPFKQEQLLKEKKVKPGDTLEYFNFEPSVLMAIKMKVNVKDRETVDVLQVKDPRAAKPEVKRVEAKLLRVEGIADKVVIGGIPLPLPKVTFWLDETFDAVRMQMDTPGLGEMTMYRTTEAVARMDGVAPGLMPDLGLNSMIVLNKDVANIHKAKLAIYRITAKDDEDPATIFVRDDRQKVLGTEGKTIRLEVRAQKQEPRDGAKPGDEYLKSSFFLDSDNEAIRKQAAAIVGNEKDPFKEAVLIEHWVKTHMTGSSDVGYAAASTIVHDLKGDCRQHGMLTAALCRAVGIPARTALGLVCAHDQDKDNNWRPVLGFHLWTEVWIKGQWLGLDATLGQGSIGPGHLKISEHSWADTTTLAPLLPVSRAMGKIKVEIEEVE